MSPWNSPLRTSFTGGMRKPSWKLSVALALKLPGTLPPTSSQWPTEASQQNSLPSRKIGRTSRMSLRWVPPS